MGLIQFDQRWARQPQGTPRIDWSSPSASGLLALFDGQQCWTPRGRSAAFYHSMGPLVATQAGIGRSFSGGSGEAIGYNIGETIGSASACTIEIICALSSAPSLALLAGLSYHPTTNGAASVLSTDFGNLRGILTFTGTNPCDLYAWGGDQDLDSNVPALGDNGLQHLVATKAAGTGAVLWSIYRNGALVAQGNSTNGRPWATSGPYFYIGGRHHLATNTVTGTVVRASAFSRAFAQAEVTARFASAWPEIAPKRIWVPVSAASGPPTLASVAASNLTASGARLTVT